MNLENLRNFPTVYSPSIGVLERSQFMIDQGKKYDINIKVFPVKSVVFDRQKFKINGKYAGSDDQKDFDKHRTLWSNYATFISYLQCMKHWFENTNEEFLIVCDDDIDFSSVEYWNFSWNHFLSLLPRKWQCLQLIRMRGDMNVKYSELPEEYIIKNHLAAIQDLNNDKLTKETIHFKIVARNMFHAHVGGGAFLLRREYVNRLIKNFIKDDEYFIDVRTPIKYYNLVNDEIVLLHNESYVVSLAEEDESFNFPIFTENTNFYTTFSIPGQSRPKARPPIWQYIKYNSSIFYKVFWQYVFQFTTIETMMSNPNGASYEIVAPNKIWTTFPENMKKEMMGQI